MKYDNRPVVYACYHENIHVPAIGTVDKTMTISAIGEKRVTKMTLNDNFLEVEITFKSKVHTILLPSVGFKSIQLAPTETKTVVNGLAGLAANTKDSKPLATAIKT